MITSDKSLIQVYGWYSKPNEGLCRYSVDIFIGTNNTYRYRTTFPIPGISPREESKKPWTFKGIEQIIFKQLQSDESLIVPCIPSDLSTFNFCNPNTLIVKATMRCLFTNNLTLQFNCEITRGTSEDSINYIKLTERWATPPPEEVPSLYFPLKRLSEFFVNPNKVLDDETHEHKQYFPKNAIPINTTLTNRAFKKLCTERPNSDLSYFRLIDSSRFYSLTKSLGFQLGEKDGSETYVIQRASDQWFEQQSKKTADEPSRIQWLVEVEETFEKFQERWAKQIVTPYIWGLRTIKSGQAFSALPLIAGGNCLWKNYFQVIESLIEKGESEPFIFCSARIIQQGHKTVECDITLGSFVTHEGQALKWHCLLETPEKEEPESGFDFVFSKLHSVKDSTDLRCRLGAFDLIFANDTGHPLPPILEEIPNRCQVKFDLLQSLLEKSPIPSISLDLCLPVSDMIPAGQDDLISEQFGGPGTLVENQQDLQRLPALVINLTETTQTSQDISETKLILKIKESIQQGASQRVDMHLHSTGFAINSGKRIMILDSQPFIVTVVDIPDFYGHSLSQITTEIANWSNTFPEGAGWRFLVGADSFDLRLPPQCIGETMEKGKRQDGYDDVNQGELIKYLFSPPMKASLGSSYFEQRYVEPPWNLRRLLESPNQRAPGAKILSMQFELLYGLTCQLQTEHLKLSETFTRLGQIPGLLREVPQYFTSHQQSKYKEYQKEWIQLYKQFLSRLAILEPWSEQQTGELMLQKGVSFALRRNAKLAYPILHEKAPPGIPANGIKGSFAWLFEENMRDDYHALWNAPTGVSGNPVSSSARLSRPYFSALGGWGKQRAAFLDDRIAIASTTEMGRNSIVSLERIGRIGVFWNIARHVIIYERSVYPSAQFANQQDLLPGWPILRKVREYVEILQPLRQYPESGITEEQQTRGFVLGCKFNTMIIPVDSRWGESRKPKVSMIPLWHGIEDDPRYPKPSIMIEVATDPDSGRSSEFRELLEPEKLCFYTLADQGGNPDKWDAVFDIDYRDLPKPIPKGKDEQEENKAIALGGYSRFTYAIKTTPRHINLMSARTEKPMGAILRNVSMMRGKLVDANSSAYELLNVCDETGNLADLFRSTAGNLRKGILTPEEQLKQLAEKGHTYLNEIKAQVEILQNKLNTAGGGYSPDILATHIKEEIEPIFNKMANEIVEFKENFDKNINVLLNEKTVTVEQLKQKLEEIVFSYKSRLLPIKDEIEHMEIVLSDCEATILQQLKQFHAKLQDGLSDVKKGHALSSEILNQMADFKLKVMQQLGSGLGKAFYANGYKLLGQGLTINTKNTISIELKTITEEVKAAVQLSGSGQIENALKVLQAAQTILVAMQSKIGDGVQKYKTELENTQIVLFTDQSFKTLQKDWDALLQQGVDAFRGNAFEKIRLFTENYKVQMTVKLLELGKQYQEMLLPEAIVRGITGYMKDELLAIEDKLVYRPIGSIEIETILQDLETMQRHLDSGLTTINNVLKKALPDFFPSHGSGSSEQTLRLLRAYGHPPEVPGMQFDKDKSVFYRFQEQDAQVLMTKNTATIAQVQTAEHMLNAVGLSLPTDRLLDRLIPDFEALKSKSLPEIFHDIAGLKLDGLFPDLNFPSINNDNIILTQQFDRETLQAVLEAKVNLPLSPGATTIFSFGPVTLRLFKPLLQALIRIETTPGEGVRRRTYGSIKGDWEIIIGGVKLVQFLDTTLSFDENNHLHFTLTPSKIKLDGALQFISERLSGNQTGGLSVDFLLKPFPIARSRISLPIPDITIPSFTLSNLQLGSFFEVGMFAAEGFGLSTGLNLAQKTAPFTMTLFMLGGGGWFESEIQYIIGQKPLLRISVGILVQATLAISLEIISGGVSITFGIKAEYDSSKIDGLTLGIILIIDGHVCVLGLIEAGLTLVLEATYSHDEGLIGRGTLKLKIKICWCFTLNINESVEYRIEPKAEPTHGILDETYDTYWQCASDYIDLMQ